MSLSTLSAVEIRDFKYTKHNFVTVTTVESLLVTTTKKSNTED